MWQLSERRKYIKTFPNTAYICDRDSKRNIMWRGRDSISQLKLHISSPAIIKYMSKSIILIAE